MRYNCMRFWSWGIMSGIWAYTTYILCSSYWDPLTWRVHVLLHGGLKYYERIQIHFFKFLKSKWFLRGLKFYFYLNFFFVFVFVSVSFFCFELVSCPRGQSHIIDITSFVRSPKVPVPFPPSRISWCILDGAPEATSSQDPTWVQLFTGYLKLLVKRAINCWNQIRKIR